MLWLIIVLGWFVTFFGGIVVGHSLRELNQRLYEVEKALEVRTKKPTPAPPPSTIIDPDDAVQQAKFEHDQLMKRLNPGENDDVS